MVGVVTRENIHKNQEGNEQTKPYIANITTNTKRLHHKPAKEMT